MRRGSFGLVGLLIVLVLLLLYASGAWKSLLPTLQQLAGTATPAPAAPDERRTAPDGTLPGERPDLEELKRRSEAYIEQVDEAMTHIDDTD